MVDGSTHASTCPGQRRPQAPLPHVPHGLPSPVHDGAGVVVVVLLVVVVVAAQPDAVQASQQLGNGPTHLAPPPCCVQCEASFLSVHFVTPLVFVRQHVTNPGFPHVDLAAHRLTTLRQLGFCSVAFAWSTAQLTYSP